MPGTAVDVHGWSDGAVAARSFVPGALQELEVEDDLSDGGWRVGVTVGPHGWTRTSIRMLAQ